MPQAIPLREATLFGQHRTSQGGHVGRSITPGPRASQFNRCCESSWRWVISKASSSPLVCGFSSDSCVICELCAENLSRLVDFMRVEFANLWQLSVIFTAISTSNVASQRRIVVFNAPPFSWIFTSIFSAPTLPSFCAFSFSLIFLLTFFRFGHSFWNTDFFRRLQLDPPSLLSFNSSFPYLCLYELLILQWKLISSRSWARVWWAAWIVVLKFLTVITECVPILLGLMPQAHRVIFKHLRLISTRYKIVSWKCCRPHFKIEWMKSLQLIGLFIIEEIFYITSFMFR